MPPPIDGKVNSAAGITTTTIKLEPPSSPTLQGDIAMPDASAPAASQKSHFEMSTTAPEEGRMAAILTPAMRAWLEPSKSGVVFAPWPAEDVIRRGALGRIQAALEEGRSVEGVDIKAESEKERRGMEGGEGPEEEVKVGVEEEAGAGGEVRRIERRAQAPARVKQETVDLGFDLYNPDEE